MSEAKHPVTRKPAKKEASVPALPKIRGSMAPATEMKIVTPDKVKTRRANPETPPQA